MAVVGTRKRGSDVYDDDREWRQKYCFDYIPEWKWDQVTRNLPPRNSHAYVEGVARLKKHMNRRRGVASSYYDPKYAPVDIFGRVPGWAKDIGLRVLKGLL